MVSPPELQSRMRVKALAVRRSKIIRMLRLWSNDRGSFKVSTLK
jgi:hypothetical protein